MNVLPISHDILTGIKRRIHRGQRKSGAFKSAHLSEALAAGFGFKSNAALQSDLKLDLNFGFARFDNDVFDDRLEELTRLGRHEVYSVLLVTPFDAIIDETGFAPLNADESLMRAATFNKEANLHQVLLNLRGTGIESITYSVDLHKLDWPRAKLVETILLPRRPGHIPAPERMDYAYLVEDVLGSPRRSQSDLTGLLWDVAEEARTYAAIHLELIFSIFTGVTYRMVTSKPDGDYIVQNASLYDDPLLDRAGEAVMTGEWDELTLRKSRELASLSPDLLGKIVEISDRARSRRAIGRGYLISAPGPSGVGTEILTPYVTRSWERQAFSEADQLGTEISLAAMRVLHDLGLLDRVQVAGAATPDNPEAGVFALNLHAQRALRHLRETRPEIFASEAKPVSA